MFEQVKIILINTTHPGNIGAVARAMKNMGLFHLCLVSPKRFPAEEAIARASGAEDILDSASVVHSFEEALEGCHWVMGLSSRARRIAWQTLTVREAASMVVEKLKNTPNFKVALVFGQEQSGLLNDALAKCHYQITIPANPSFASLNLAQAVQIMAYELRMAIEAVDKIGIHPEQTLETSQGKSSERIEATAEEMEGFYTHLEDILIKTQFLDPKKPGFLMLHLRRLYAKARVTQSELNILRGILTSVQKRV